MAHSLNPLVCFNGGEWSPTLDSRIDIPNYRKACRQLRNMIPMNQGGATRRPGTDFIALGKPATNGAMIQAMTRLQKFQYAPSTSLVIGFGDLGARFYLNGAEIQAPTPSAWVSLQPYPAGAFATYLGNTYYAYRSTVKSSTPPSLDPVHWRAQTAYEVPLPYSAVNYSGNDYWTADVFVLQCKQINDVVYIVHPSFAPWKLTRYANNNWVSQKVQFLTPALLDQNATDTTIASSSAAVGPANITMSAPAWVTATYYTPGNSVSSGGFIYDCLVVNTSGAAFADDLALGYWQLNPGFNIGHVNSYWQLAYNRTAAFVSHDITTNNTSATLYLVGTWSVQTFGVWSADIAIEASYDNGVTFQTITSLTSRADANYNISGEDVTGGIYRMVVTNFSATTSSTPPRVVLTADNQFVYGLVQILSISSTYVAATNVITPLFDTSATPYWSEGAWSTYRGFPQAITIFQERVWYAASTYEPQRIWATQTADLENFALIDQSQATYGMAFDLNAPTRGPIEWLNAQTDLYAGLAGAEWIITSGQQNAPITPTAVIAVEHSANGSAPGVPGMIIGNAAFYVQRKGTAFQQMLFSVFTNKYMSQDMMLLSQHLTAARIKQFDYQQEFQNQSLLWAVCGDGTLISLTYSMDQEIFGWAKHTTNSPGGAAADFGFVSVQTIYGEAGQDDEVWVSVLRAGALYCTIERIHPVDWQTYNVGLPQLNQAVFADCSVAVTSPMTNTIGGLPTLLAGKIGCAAITPVAGTGTIAVGNLTISNTGTVTIPNYQPQAGDVVVVGLPIPWVVQPMRLDLDLRAGEIPAVKKSISKLFPRTLNSIGGNWGTLQGDVVPLGAYLITQNSGNPPPFLPNVPLDVEVDCAVLMQYDKDPVFYILGSDPLPFTLLGITVVYDIGGKL